MAPNGSVKGGSSLRQVYTPDTSSHGSPPFTKPVNSPHSLRDALQDVAAKSGAGSAASESPSEEDYDEVTKPPVTLAKGPKHAEAVYDGQPARRGDKVPVVTEISTEGGTTLPGIQDIDGIQDPRSYLLTADEAELREILRRGLQKAQEPVPTKNRGRFRDLVFTRKFSTFDRQNEAAANSPFHGFFTLFWIAVFLYMVKIAAENWKRHGNPLGTNEIMKNMFRRDVLVLLISDGVICAITAVSWALQRLVLRGTIDWNRSGWVLQNLWQTLFIAGVIGWTQLRDWPWSHTVFFVMHGIVMLMKQHSYAFYNGYLSSQYKRRADLLAKLKQLDAVRPVQSPSRTEPRASVISTSHLTKPPSAHELKERRMSMSQATVGGDQPSDIDKIARAIKSGEPLDFEQVDVFERIIKWEVDSLTEELKGKATKPERAYPHSLTLYNHCEYILLPTVVYELEYPRSDSINWFYVAEKLAACFGVIFVMIMVSQAFIYPVVMKTVEMKEIGMPLAQRFHTFPWMLSDLLFPLMMEYLLSWYLIWETILNVLAELTYFADRSFYDAWWNSVTWDQFARDWNRPVHNFLLRHVYHSSISAMKVNKHTATLITFFLSACVHELVMWCIFKKLRGYLLFLQMCQLPLVKLSRTRWLRNKKTLGNVIFWFGIFMGPSILCSLYLIL